MKSDKTKEILILFLTIVLLCTSCGKEKEKPAAEATTMSLMKTEGSVTIDDRDGKQIEPVNDLKLYSGYHMFTKKTSYAWINLDRIKLAKMDEKSEIKIQKDDKRLEIHVSSGNLFFHVKEPLKEDESMNIHPSTMTVGIRGTCGWTVNINESHSQVYILEGIVAVQTKDNETAQVHPGQKTDVTVNKNGKSKLAISEFTVEDIPEFVMTEIIQDEDLAAKILEASGLDVLNPSDEELRLEAYQAILDEYTAAANVTLNDSDDLFEQLYGEQYPNVDEYAMDYYLRDTVESSWNLYYAYYDIDKNGSDELLIGIKIDGTEPTFIMDLYTFDGRQAVKSAIHESAGFQIYSNGTIWEYNSIVPTGRKGHDTDSLYYAYRKIAEDGYTMITEYEYRTRSLAEGVQCFKNNQPITQEEFNEMTDSLSDLLVDDFDWNTL